ncbi:MAG: hypothetical protein ACRENK_09925 [Gemmatimonadaceae bacterium]
MKLRKTSVTERPLFLLLILSSVAAAPGHLSAQSRALGIGAIVDTVDYTTDSFNFFRYFKSHPVLVSGDTLQSVLVDRAADADFAITGVVETQIEHRKNDEALRFSYSHDADVSVWRDGKKLGDVHAMCSGNAHRGDKGPDPTLDDLRYTTMTECFDKLRTDIASMLSRGVVRGGAQ